ncbi:MAG: response regulator [Candidatus Korobacteraceae bacterium]|jgi:DNA-binding response OmpR family regulator
MATVLLVDDSVVIRQGLGRALEESGFEVLFAVDGEQALEIARRTSPDLILLDLFLPKLSGWDVIKALKNLPLTSRTPVIVLTSLTQSEAKLGQADVSAFFEKSKLDLVRGSEELIQVVGNTLRAAVRRQSGATADASVQTSRRAAMPIVGGRKVLVADDCLLQLRAMSSGLSKNGFKVSLASDALQAWMTTLRERPDAVILDINMPGGTGLEVLKRLRLSAKTQTIPVIVVSGSEDPGVEQTVKSMGAAEFFHKPVNMDELCVAVCRVLAA